jgi:chromosome segregation ATPase
MADTNVRLDGVMTSIAELRTNRPDLTSSLQAIGSVVEAVQGAITDTHDRIDVLGELVRQAAEPRDTTGPMFAQVSQRLDALAARVGQGEQRFEDVLAGIALAVDQIEQASAAQDERAARLDDRLTALANRDDPSAGVHDILAAIDRRGEVDAELRGLVTGLAAEVGSVRQDLDPTEGYRLIGGALQEVRTDVQAARTELLSLAHTVSDLRTEARRTESDLGGGAAAALVASAASAMARLETRIDGEFDAVSRQMEALGTLLGQTIEAVHRVESQVVGVQPTSEKLHTDHLRLDALRANVRQRSRYAGPPPELGSGHDVY